MIFVTIGTSEPFDRLIGVIGELNTNEEIVAQVGVSKLRPSGVQCRDFLSFDETLEYMRGARIVIAHAGVGTVLSALRVGHLPVVATRLREYGEAVDDHQVAFARRLAERGLVRLVEDLSRLGDTLEEVRPRFVQEGKPSPLARDLRAYLNAVLGA